MSCDKYWYRNNHARAIRNNDEGSQRPRQQEVRKESSNVSDFGEGSRSDQQGGSGRSFGSSSGRISEPRAWEDRGRASRPRKIDNIKSSYNTMKKAKDADPAPSQDRDVKKTSPSRTKDSDSIR